MRGCSTSPLIFRLLWRPPLRRTGSSPRHLGGVFWDAPGDEEP